MAETRTTTQGDIDAFLDGAPFAVVGASTDRSKYGNKVLRVYLQQGLKAHPVNPNAEEVEGLKAYPDLSSIPEKPHGVSIITPPTVTEQVVSEAIQLGISHLWLQPGAESETAIRKAEEAGGNVIAGGACILAHFGFDED